MNETAPSRLADPNRDRRDPPARAARDRLGDWLEIAPVIIGELPAQPAETIAVASEAFAFAANRVIDLQDQLRELSERLTSLEAAVRTDHLTGIANRMAIEERLEMEWSRATRHGHDLSVIAIDCDRFKQINDTFGHGAGDDLLRGVASVLRRVVRAADLPGRVGGDEFFVICPHTDHEGVALAADKIARAVASELVGGARNQPGAIPVTVSVGWAHSREQANWRDLVQQADLALIAAKVRQKRAN